MKNYGDVLQEIINVVRTYEKEFNFKLNQLEKARDNLAYSYDYAIDDKTANQFKVKSIPFFNQSYKEILRIFLELHSDSKYNIDSNLIIYFKQFIMLVNIKDLKGIKDPHKVLLKEIANFELMNLEQIILFYSKNAFGFDLEEEGNQIKLLISNQCIEYNEETFKETCHYLVNVINLAIEIISPKDLPGFQNVLPILKDCLVELHSTVAQLIQQKQDMEYRKLAIKILASLTQLYGKSRLNKDSITSNKLFSYLNDKEECDMIELKNIIEENCFSEDTTTKIDFTILATSRESKMLEQLILLKEENKELKKQLENTKNKSLRCTIS